jgi:hypothetical protein
MKVSQNNKLFRAWRVFAVALVVVVAVVAVMSARAHAGAWAGKVTTVEA